MNLAVFDRALRALAIASLLLIGCGKTSKPKPISGDASPIQSSDEDDAGIDATKNPLRSECKGRAMGAGCGDDKYCIEDRCVFNTCGDGVRSPNEECDDGNVAVGDGCDAACKAEPKGCGNGAVEKGEECDDGNHVDEDACTNACTRNQCGNQRIDVGEECDDGNTVNNDKCSNACLIVRCRNGRLDPGERCDDGNQIDDDGCTNKCTIRVCGNGTVDDEREECDDGNTNDTDGCSNACSKNVCGNKRIDPGESCDGSLDCDDKCKSVPDACTPCERKHCRDYLLEGLYPVDLFGGCVEGMPVLDEVFAQPVELPGPEFSGLCKAVLECSRVSHCLSADRDPSDTCYCGNASPNDCIQKGPASDAACVQPLLKAALTMDNTQYTARVTDPAYPAGFAHYMLKCDREFCKQECTPWLVN